MFTVEHVKKLVFFLSERATKEFCPGYLRPYKNDIINLFFPTLFVERAPSWHARHLLRSFAAVRLSGLSEYYADGMYFLKFCGDECRDGLIERVGGDDAVALRICLDDERGLVLGHKTHPGSPNSTQVDALWYAPCSSNLPMPPRDNWQAVDEMVSGNPRLEYVPRDSYWG